MWKRLGILALAAGLMAWPAGAGAAKVIKDATVTISLGPDAETMDPHTASSAIITTLHSYVFDTLMNRPAGKAIPEPWAAKSVKAIDPKTFEFQMREGVKFTNGEDVDAEAVKFSLSRPKDPNLRTVQRRLFQVIDRVEVVSKWVARVYLAYPDPGFLNRMANRGHLVPPKHYSKITQQEAAVKPVGSGPYRLASWRKGVEMVFEANPDYWKPGAPKVKRVRLVPIKEMGTRVASLLKGEVDIIRDIPAHLIPQIEANPNTRVYQTRNVRIFHVGFTHGIKGPLQDRRVRQAVAHAIDRDLLVKAVIEGKGVVANQPLHEWTEGNDPDRKWPYEFNVEKAKKLLAEAGYPKGLDIEFYSTVGRYPKDKEVAEAISGMLQKAGIRTNFQAITWNTFVNRFRGKDRPGTKPFLFYIGYGNGSGDSDQTLIALAGCKGAWSAYCNPEIEKIMKAAASNMDLAERGRLFRRITEEMAKDVSHVFIWQADDIYGMTKRIKWQVRNDDRIDAWELDVQ